MITPSAMPIAVLIVLNPIRYGFKRNMRRHPTFQHSSDQTNVAIE